MCDKATEGVLPGIKTDFCTLKSEQIKNNRGPFVVQRQRFSPSSIFPRSCTFSSLGVCPSVNCHIWHTGPPDPPHLPALSPHLPTAGKERWLRACVCVRIQPPPPLQASRGGWCNLRCRSADKDSLVCLLVSGSLSPHCVLQVRPNLLAPHYYFLTFSRRFDSWEESGEDIVTVAADVRAHAASRQRLNCPSSRPPPPQSLPCSRHGSHLSSLCPLRWCGITSGASGADRGVLEYRSCSALSLSSCWSFLPPCLCDKATGADGLWLHTLFLVPFVHFSVCVCVRAIYFQQGVVGVLQSARHAYPCSSC